MSNTLEFEAKVLLSETDYYSLLDIFSNSLPYVQVNHYVDTTNLELRKNNVSLRIREKENCNELTLKTLVPGGGRLETTDIISDEEREAIKTGASFPEGEVKHTLESLHFDVSKLTIVASLKTKRIDLQYLGGILSIDENHYSDIVDYEIEYESDSLAKAELILQALLESKGIAFIQNKTTKTARALNAAKK